MSELQKKYACHKQLYDRLCSPQYISSDPSPQSFAPSQMTPNGPAGTQRPLLHWNSFTLQPPGETGEGGIEVAIQRSP